MNSKIRILAATFTVFWVALVTLNMTDSKALDQNSAQFRLDPDSTVKFNPLQYDVEIDHQNFLPFPSYEVFLTDHPEEYKELHEPYFHSAPKTSHIGRKDLRIYFEHGRPSVNKEYRVIAESKDLLGDWRQTNLTLKNEDGSNLYASFTTFADSRSKGVRMTEMKVTYLSVPEKAGDELRLKFEALFEDGGFIRGSLNAPIEEEPLRISKPR